MHKSKFIMVGLLNVMVIWSLKAQTSYTDYLWHSPETYAESKVGGFTLYYNSPPDNPEPTSKGIAFGDYVLNAKGKLDHGFFSELRYARWYGIKDSIAFIQVEDTLFKRTWTTYLTDRYERDIDYSFPKQPQFEAYTEEDMIEKRDIYNDEGRVSVSYGNYDTTYYHYDLDGRLASKEMHSLQQTELGINEPKHHYYDYNQQGFLIQELEIRPWPDKYDTLVAHYQYNAEGRLIMKIPSSPLFSQPDTTFYEYQENLLVREETHQNTHVRREPVTHIFETTYRYSEDQLIERKVVRNGELETWEQYTYYPNGLIREKKNLRLDNGEPVEVLTWEYRFTD